MSQDAQPFVVHQPIPRRPFAKPAIPLEHEKDERDATEDAVQTMGQKRLAQLDCLQILAPGDAARRIRDTHKQNLYDLSIPLTPTGSSAFLSSMTSSTLFGIFGSTSDITPFETSTPTRTQFGSDENENENENEDGEEDRRSGVTDADVAAIRQASMDLLMLQRQGKHPGQRDGPDGGYSRPQQWTASTSAHAQLQSSCGRIFVFGRAVLLFVLGMGYGVLVSRLHSETQDRFVDGTAASAVEQDTASAARRGTAYDATNDWCYLVSWGISGVVLGLLLPWFDSLWNRTFGIDGQHARDKSHMAPETDWALVVRGIGAFAGIALAMRKLQWASTLQASLTLALTNPFLWYLLDRSKSGLLLATAVGLVGSVVLTALELDLMPNPGSRRDDLYATHCGGNGVYASQFNGSTTLSSASRAESSSSATAISSSASTAATAAAAAAAAARNLVSGATVEMAIWMVSVLFCSCVCFGNIGRRLALRPATVLTSAVVGVASS
ncbi:insig domain containing protein [Grosmannia clavigera kw1407]|uniref:Insig domain containing protein n=1 Tax=Grosmannia clavigera (strain kw1407 / UAMH 11150) TaxID=655863 RepID=F0XH28_GROCL|nr:insig domain containing protein [Grosmannia clavigera kw1407]EFX03039.1 insig domain containing protein [Grosmannia clavigera kw1407]